MGSFNSIETVRDDILFLLRGKFGIKFQPSLIEQIRIKLFPR